MGSVPPGMDFLAQLNPQQREAVEHTQGPLLILAGAGSGKTRVITCRIAHLIRHLGVSPAHLLAVTFTNKAAGEMRERVVSLLGPGAAAPLVSTFHSVSVRLLRQHGEPLAELRPGFTPRFTIYDDTDQLQVVKSVCRELGLDDKILPARTALARLGDAKTGGLSPEEYFRTARDPLAEKVAVVYERYEAALRRANALDFDDLLLETVRLLARFEDVRQRLVDRFHHVMIDEYQDTNRTQYRLVRLLAEPRRNLCVVGDEDQSIYGWRGADLRNILDFERDYPGARLIRLEQNYRSTRNILDAAGQVVARNQQRKGKNLWTTSDAGPSLVFYEGEDAENEALFIADYITKYLRANPTARVAVLYRTNFQSRPIEEALRRYGRKYLLVGGLSFYQRAEVKDMLAYLKAAASPQDSYSLLRIINTPARGIGRSTVDQIERHATTRGLTFWEALEDLLASGVFPARAQAALGAFRDLMGELRRQAATEPLNEVLVWLREATGYQRMLEQEGSVESQGRQENINELINAAADSVERGESLAEFLDHAALVADTDDLDEAAQVTLLTLHSAKGLEFSLVMMAGLEDGIFPHSRCLDSESGVEEERRLCYVGMTRARQQLVLTRARSRRRFGGGELEVTRPSRFLAEIPEGLVEDFSPRRRAAADFDHVDLYAERQQVREIARRNAFTGKTYNSVENVAEYFAARGVEVPLPKTTVAPPARPVAAAPARRPASAPAAARGGRWRAGVRVSHPKYGTGTVLRCEGDGEDAKITVSFPRHGVKKLIEKYATLSQE
jgi:DNA helicase-2/ATP-dependent DNA helicase PcrA